MSNMLWAYARPVPLTAVPPSWVVSFAKIGSVSKMGKSKGSVAGSPVALKGVEYYKPS